MSLVPWPGGHLPLDGDADILWRGRLGALELAATHIFFKSSGVAPVWMGRLRARVPRSVDVIYPVQWPGSGQTARPRAAMLLLEMARQAGTR
jgi:hypothetical protein